MQSDRLKAAAASFGRLLATTTATAIVAVWQSTPTHDFGTWADVKAFLWAVAGAAGMTLINALRTGETRFGRTLDGHDAVQAAVESGDMNRLAQVLASQGMSVVMEDPTAPDQSLPSPPSGF